MPCYAYRCATCGTDKDEFNRIDDRHVNAPRCCGAAMGIVPQVGMVYVAHPNFQAKSPIDGTVLSTYRQRADYMKRHNLVDANDTPPKAVIEKARKKIQARKELAAKLPQPEAIKREVFNI